MPGPKSIVLVGFMGAGKTTIGRRLADRLEMPFVDIDREIEAAFGLSVTEIFALHGEQEFRKAERGLVVDCIASGARVISVGGGCYVDDETRTAINDRAIAIWLDPPFELIIERLARSTTRPLASGKSPEELRELWARRRHCYAEANIRVETSEGDPEATIEKILKALA